MSILAITRRIGRLKKLTRPQLLTPVLRTAPATMMFLALVLASGSEAIAGNDLQSVTKIAVDGPPNPDHFGLAVGDVASAVAFGATFGPGATEGILEGTRAGSAKANTLTNAMSGENFRLGDELRQAVVASLIDDGYQIASSDAKATADAVLNLSIDECTYERRVWGLIGPHLIVSASLEDPQTKKTLFRHVYWYDMHSLFSFGHLTTYKPEERYGFDSASEVIAHPATVVAGFRAAILPIAAGLKADLKK